MYRTWNFPENEKYVISHWDGDTSSYTVCESEEEYKKETERIRKIREESERIHGDLRYETSR